MKDEKVRSLLQDVLRENPDILDEALATYKDDFTRLEKPQTIRLTVRQKERIQKLCPEKRKQAEIIRRALEIGLTQLEKQ